MWTFLFTFLAGFASLGSETIYLKLLDYSIGSAPLLVFITVGSFILGQGLGAWLGLKISRIYLVELILSVYSFAWAFFHETLESTIAHGLVFMNGNINVSAGIIAIILISIPCLGLGMSFPALVELNKSASKTSALHALGGVLGIVAMEFLGFPNLGIFNCLIFLGVIHLATAVYLSQFKFSVSNVSIKFQGGIVALGFLTGGIQGIYLMLMGYAFQPFYFIHVVVISGFIFGLSAGAWWWSREKFSLDNSRLLIGIGLVVSLLALTLLVKLPLHRFPSTLSLCLLWILVLIVAVPIGTLFPALMQTHFQRITTTSVNLNLSVGNFLGLIFANLWVTYFPAHEWLLVIVALLIIRSFLLLKKKVLEFVIILGCCIFVIFNLSEKQLIGLTTLSSPIEIEKIFRNPGELSAIYSVSYPGENGLFKHERRLYQNGFSAIDINEQNESIISLLGAQYSASYNRALVLGVGSGRSAGTVSKLFDHTDVVDVSPSVKDISKYLAKENFDIMNNPNVSYWDMDGILFPYLKSGPYDLIVLTVDPGFHYQAAKLYTTEYFQKLSLLLGENGVLVFWLDSSLSLEAQQIVINSSKPSFPNQKMSYIFKNEHNVPSYYVVINSQKELTARQIDLSQWSHFASYLDSTHLFERSFDSTTNTNSIYKPAWSVILGGFYRNTK